jgi:uncharacterized protein (TIGR02996 family)
MSPPLSSTAPLARPQVRAFLDDIKDHPEDDTPRLVLADWLEEYGGTEDQARAELIRVQCERESLAEDDPRVGGLDRRAKELIALHAEDWLGPVRGLAEGWSFERGLPRLVLGRTSSQNGADQLEGLAHTETWAWVEGIQVSPTAPESVLGLAAYSLLEGITTLSLKEGRPGIWGIERLFNPACLRRLHTLQIDRAARSMARGLYGLLSLSRWPAVRRLVMRGLGLNASAVEELARCPHLATLTVLDLEGNKVGQAGAEILAASLHLAALTRLSVPGNAVGDAGLRALVQSTHLSRLVALDLRDNRICPEGAAALVGSQGRFFTSLNLRKNRLGDAGAIGLAAAACLARLTFLNLGDNKVGPAGARALAGSRHLARLAVLDLGHNAVGPEGAEALASSPHLGGLTTLDLSANGIGDRGARALAASNLAHLQSLHLAGNRIGAEGARALAGSASLGQLQLLDLADNEVGVPGALALAESPHLGALQSLNLHGNGVGDKGARALASSPALARLRHLGLSGNYIGAAGRKALQERFGDAVEV